MSKMIRKQVYIEPEQEALLKRLSKEQGLTEAELIRSGILRLSSRSDVVRDITFWEEEKRFIRSLMKKGTLKGKRRWKREDLYER
jgi:hypothetical protein